MECLDCKISEIPEGHTGIVFLECEDRVGSFHLCRPCWRKRREEVRRNEVEARQRLIDEEQKAMGKKKKKSSGRRGPNNQGPSH